MRKGGSGKGGVDGIRWCMKKPIYHYGVGGCHCHTINYYHAGGSRWGGVVGVRVVSLRYSRDMIEKMYLV